MGYHITLTKLGAVTECLTEMDEDLATVEQRALQMINTGVADKAEIRKIEDAPVRTLTEGS